MLFVVQMIYFLMATLVLGQNPTKLKISGVQSVLQFGSENDSVTLVRDATEDELVCSGKIKASDMLIEGTSTTVAALIGEVANLRQEMGQMQSWLFIQRALSLRIRLDLDAMSLRDALGHGQPFSTLPHGKWLDGSGKGNDACCATLCETDPVLHSNTSMPYMRFNGSAGSGFLNIPTLPSQLHTNSSFTVVLLSRNRHDSWDTTTPSNTRPLVVYGKIGFTRSAFEIIASHSGPNSGLQYGGRSTDTNCEGLGRMVPANEGCCDSWHVYVVSFDARSLEYCSYVDGAPGSPNACVTGVSTDPNTIGGFQIGGDVNKYPNRRTNFDLAKLRIYDGVLSQPEVNYLSAELRAAYT
jgi:hypothetical protein